MDTNFKETVLPELTSPKLPYISQLEQYLVDHQIQIEAWFRQQWNKYKPPIYASVDLRNAGFKIAPVDTNLFPAGFNNLNPQFLPLYIQIVQNTLDKFSPGCLRILLIPELYTRNFYYLENIATLQELLRKAGYDVRMGSLQEDLQEDLVIDLPSGKKIILQPLLRENDKIFVKDFHPCFVLLNNDLSAGIPKILENLKQTIYPPLKLGWNERLKSSHFQHYSAVTEEFSKLISMDSWFINPLFSRCDNVNFMTRDGDQCLVKEAEKLLLTIHKKYDEYEIKQKPYLVIKAESGTHGRGVLVVHDPEEITNLNRKQRSDMGKIQANREVRQVILQEGVYTFETWQNAVAEPVVYLFGQCVLGGFYRVHTGRGITDNLNAPGMHFAPLPFHAACNVAQEADLSINRLYVYGVIARLALLAAAREQA